MDESFPFDKKKRRSFFFRRIITLILTSLILWTILTPLLYSVIARPVFTRLKVNDIKPKARVMVNHIASLRPPHVDAYAHLMIHSSYDLFGAWMYVIMNESMTSTRLPSSLEDASPFLSEQVLTLHDELQEEPQEALTSVRKIPHMPGDVVLLAVPIMSEETGYTCIGSVVFAQPIAEINAAFSSLLIALLFSSLIIFRLMLVPALIATYRLLKPLQEVRTTALRMIQGDFSHRADETVDGELGELAVAVNHLAEELSSTFDELTLERNRLRQIIDSMDEGLIAVDRDIRVTLSNHTVWNLFGISRYAQGGNADLHIVTRFDLDDIFQDVFEKRSKRTDILDIDGRKICCLISPLQDEQHVVIGAVGLFRDITESERLEQTRRDYVANVSHELRAPITSMRALIEPLNEGMVRSESDRRRYYSILLRETLRLSRLINDMLELSRLQSGKTALIQGPFNIIDLIRDVNLRYIVQAEEQEISLSVQLPREHMGLEDAPLAWGNRDRVEQILIILLDNAFKFTSEGGSITLRLVETSKEYLLSIIDTGEGMTQDDADQIFDRFFKADRAHNEPTGLPCHCQRNCRSNGTNDHRRDEARRGSTFTLSLQYADDVLRSSQHLKDVFESDETDEF